MAVAESGHEQILRITVLVIQVQMRRGLLHYFRIHGKEKLRVVSHEIVQMGGSNVLKKVRL